MPTESLSVSTILPVAPMKIYEAWTNGAKHGAMIGAAASIEAGVGGRFTAWDDYIRGTTRELEPGRRIVQSWRTTQFPADASDSRVEIRLEPEASGTRVTIVHTEIPQGQGASYRDGWDEFYFKPMRKYFAQAAAGRAAPKRSVAKAAAPTKAAVTKAAATKAAPKKAAPKKPAATKAAPKKPAATKAAPKKPAAKKAASKKAAPKRARAASKRGPAKRR